MPGSQPHVAGAVAAALQAQATLRDPPPQQPLGRLSVQAQQLADQGALAMRPPWLKRRSSSSEVLLAGAWVEGRIRCPGRPSLLGPLGFGLNSDAGCNVAGERRALTVPEAAV